jgi:hypothetical protein
MSVIADYFDTTNDPYRPSFDKPELGQWDNYQIYDLYCVDLPVESTLVAGTYTNNYIEPNNFNQFLAVQAVGIRPVTLDFTRIVLDYPVNYANVMTTNINYVGRVNLTTGVQLHSSIDNFYREIFTQEYIDLVAGISTNDLEFYPPFINYGSATSLFRIDRIVGGRTVSGVPTPPCYIDLLSGYNLDPRVKSTSKCRLLSPTDKTVAISYYRENTHESIPGLRSIDWRSFDIILAANIPYYIDLSFAVLGTLNTSDESISKQIKDTTTAANEYPFGAYFNDSLPALFAYWQSFYSDRVPATPTAPNGYTVNRTETSKHLDSIVRKIAANNNHWNNADLSANIDINADSSHPMFAIDENRSNVWHLNPQTEGIGSLIMDSTRTIEIHAALNAGKYAVNELDATKDRVTNIGYLVENACRVLGLRLDANGNIDRAAERAKYLPATLNQPTLGEVDASGKYQNYDLTCWGKRGRMTPHLPTTYTPDGKATKLYDVFHDLPQMLEALLRQLDVSLSIQHGSEIRYKGLDGTVRAYPNQLAMSIECLTQLERINSNTQKTLNTSLVMGNELRGMMSGIGYPVEQRYLQLKDGSSGVVLSLPYFGHQKNKPSIAETLTTVMVNQAIVNGVLMPKRQPPKSKLLNPFAKYLPKE